MGKKAQQEREEMLRSMEKPANFPGPNQPPRRNIVEVALGLIVGIAVTTLVLWLLH